MPRRKIDQVVRAAVLEELRNHVPAKETRSATLLHYYCKILYSYRAWITLIKLPYAPLWYRLAGPNIHLVE